MPIKKKRANKVIVIMDDDILKVVSLSGEFVYILVENKKLVLKAKI